MSRLSKRLAEEPTRVDALLLEDSVVQARQACDRRSRHHALVATVHGAVETLNGLVIEQTAKGHALSVNNKSNKALGDAEDQRVDSILGEGSTAAGTGCTASAVSSQVEEVSKNGRQEEGGEEPSQSRGPEGRSNQEEHVRHVDRVVRSSEGANGGNGEGVAVSKDLGADVVQLNEGDESDDGVDGGEMGAGRLSDVGDTALAVDGRDALADGERGAIGALGNVGRRSWERNARGNLRQRATRSLNEGRRGGAVDPARC